METERPGVENHIHVHRQYIIGETVTLNEFLSLNKVTTDLYVNESLVMTDQVVTATSWSQGSVFTKIGPSRSVSMA